MKRIVLSLLVVLILALTACAGQPTPPPTQTPSTPTEPFPTGRFNGNGQSIQYSPDGTFEFYTAASKIIPTFTGKYTVDGNLITSENPGENDPKCQGKATYQWLFDNGVLTFSPTADDPCKGRREANADTYVYDAAYLPEITINAGDFSYLAPVKLRAGWVKVNLKNTGNEPHHVQFMRLNDGVTVSQFEDALKHAEGPALAMTRQMGGVGAIAPGMESSAVINLPAGEYVILCLVPSPSDGVAHHAKGMIRSLTVDPANGHGNEPSANLTIHLKDFVFDMPDTLPAGPLSIQVINDGPEPHELNILQLAEGKTMNDVIQFLNGAGGPPPFVPVGGMNGLDIGLTGYAEINLDPGTYIVICNIPSPKTEGRPHFSLGMIKEFRVQ